MVTCRELIAILQQADPESDAEVAVWQWMKDLPLKPPVWTWSAPIVTWYPPDD